MEISAAAPVINPLKERQQFFLKKYTISPNRKPLPGWLNKNLYRVISWR
jgi:hypothetical protein